MYTDKFKYSSHVSISHVDNETKRFSGRPRSFVLKEQKILTCKMDSSKLLPLKNKTRLHKTSNEKSCDTPGSL